MCYTVQMLKKQLSKATTQTSLIENDSDSWKSQALLVDNLA